MSIISALRTYLLTCPSLASGALVLVDHAGSEPIGYSIVPMPGERIAKTYVTGKTVREYPFAFQTVASTADNLARIESAAWNEIFADWLEAQTKAGSLPTLDTGKTAIGVEAVNWGYLYEEGESQTGIYQIVCKLTFEQQP